MIHSQRIQKLVTGRCSTTLISTFSSTYEDHKLSSDLIHTFYDAQMVYNNLLILVYRLQLKYQFIYHISDS